MTGGGGGTKGVAGGLHGGGGTKPRLQGGEGIIGATIQGKDIAGRSHRDYKGPKVRTY